MYIGLVTHNNVFKTAKNNPKYNATKISKKKNKCINATPLGLVDIFERFPDKGHMKAFIYRSCCAKGFCSKINILEGKF